MKGTKIISIFLATLLLGVATAGLIATFDKEVELTKDEKTALAGEGIIDPDISELNCIEDRCFFTLSQHETMEVSEVEENETHTVSVLIWKRDLTIPYRDSNGNKLSSALLLETRDDAIEMAMKNYANATIQRNDKSISKEVDGGKITIKEVKDEK